MPTTEIGDSQRWVSAKTAAKILGMSGRTVRYLCADGELPARKFGRAWRIRREAVFPDGETEKEHAASAA